MARIAIFHPTDPLGNVPGGIDSFIKGTLKWAPDDLEYTLFGASSDTVARPLGKEHRVDTCGARESRFIPLVSMDASGKRRAVPLTVRYMAALVRHIQRGTFRKFDILDFHRVEPVFLFSWSSRPKNVTIHADSSVLRDQKCDIMWRHAPWLYDRIESMAFLTLDRIFAVRRSAVKRYSAMYPRMANKFVFIPTWVDINAFKPTSSIRERDKLRFRLAQTFGLPFNAKWLVFVGRLDHQKDPLLLLHAFREVIRRGTGAHLLVIGDGILLPEVEAMSQSIGINDQISLLGVRRSDEIADVLKASDVFVLSSAYEGMSIAVLEALATGLPVVSTAVGEIDLVVQNGINGQVSKDRSPTGFADAICSVISRLSVMHGTPCVEAVLPYQPARVLSQVHENHRRQFAETSDSHR